MRQKTHKDTQTVMEKSLLLALLISGLSSSAYSWYYHFVNENMTWLEAQNYCRAKYIDLVTVDNMKQMNQLMKRVDPTFRSSFWIGLNRVPPRRWGWSSGEISLYIGWNNGEPNDGDRDGLCAAKNNFTGWVDSPCSLSYEFVCYSELRGTFINISKPLSWRAAQAYCRQHYTDLATVHNEEEQQYLSELLGNVPYAWIGGFFDNWKWSDHKNSTFRYWIPGQPWSLTGHDDCVVAVTGWNGQWDNTPCDAKVPFMCYDVKQQNLVKLTITSGGQDLNDPALQTGILNQIEENLSLQGLNDITLSWRVKNGAVFYLDRNKKIIKKDKCV